MMSANRSGTSGAFPMASAMVSANFTGSAVSSTTIGVSTSPAICSATWIPSAVCGSTSTPNSSCTRLMVATRSAWVEVPEAKPNSPRMRSITSSPPRSEVAKPPFFTLLPNSSEVRSESRNVASKSIRSKLDALEMSMDGEDVAWVSAAERGRYSPRAKKSWSTSFSFVATMRRSMGRPICFAMWPAHTLPKLPVGTQNETRSSLVSVTLR